MLDVAVEEIAEVVNHNLLHFGNIQMFCNEWCKCSQKAVRKRLFVYAFNDFPGRKVVFVQKQFLNIIIDHIFQQITNEAFAQRIACTFITKNEPQSRNILGNVFSIVETGV